MLNILHCVNNCRCNSFRCYNLFLKEKTCLSNGTTLHESTMQGLHVKNINDADDDIEKKIVHNTKLNYEKTIGQKIKTYNSKEVERLPSSNKAPPVLALKYFNLTDNNCENLKKQDESVNLPYRRHFSVQLQNSHEEDLVTESTNNEIYNKSDITNDQDLSFNYVRDKSCRASKSKWMADYNKYKEISVKQLKEDKEESEQETEGDSWNVNYGSADPNQAASSVPCGGCGAHLHCQVLKRGVKRNRNNGVVGRASIDPGIPGYLPKELFAGLSDAQLQALVCQRCHFLREYNTALSVSVDPELYPKLLSELRRQMALVVLVVDMTDFPCSIWPGILDVIGPKRPLVVVGNKTDLLQDWSKNMLENARKSLLKQLPAKANILHSALISAKTGFGIEELVTALYRIWEYRGDVYLVGCTNVGKSSLFNALLQSDYCKTKAVDLMQRATTAPWPGTTLNLLKFPIMRPEVWRFAVRTERLRLQGAANMDEPRSRPQIVSKINRTFSHGNTNKYSDDYWDDPFAMPKLTTLRRLKDSGSGLDPSDPDFVNSKWLYDTPGVITPDQIIDLLTTEELMLTLPKQAIIPRSFVVWAGQSLLVGGLARLDYINGPENIKMTVLAAATLPVTICHTKDTEAVYNHYLGSELLAVPRGSEERLKLWPGLHPGPSFSLRGEGWRVSCTDVVLSSAGWIAVTALQDTFSELQAWTPHARGIHVRIPPVLPRAIAVKGRRMYKSQAYALFNEYIQKPK